MTTTTIEPLTQTTLPPSLQAYLADTLPRMDGWCTPEKAASLMATVLAAKPRVAVEIGVFAGRSILAIAAAMRWTKQGRVLGIDPWSSAASVAGFANDPANRDWWTRLDHNAIYQQFMDTRHRLDLESVCAVFPGTSGQAATALRFAHPTPFIDLLHIDGNHSTAQALADVNDYVPLVVPGGTIYMDDLEWETTKPAQARLDQLCDKLSEVVVDSRRCGIFKRR